MPRGTAASVLYLLVAVTALVLTGAARADAACANPVACENELPGSGKPWELANSGDPNIQGYATTMSVNKGQPISFKVDTASTNYRIDIYRLGYYGGSGSRKWATIENPAGTNHGPCPITPSTGLVNCASWSVSATWNVPANAVSGVYLAHLVREDGPNGSSVIPFVVRDDASHSAVVLSTSDADWQAYNEYGGNSLYVCATCPTLPGGTPQRAYQVSYNRPFVNADVQSGRPWLFRSEYAMIRFLEANGYDLSYTSSVDVHNATRGPLLKNHQLFVSSGQDEYWSETQRAHVESARDAGVNLAFFSGNELFWKTRWEPGDRTITSYKETHANASIDPTEWTGTWQDPRFSPPDDGGRPQNALTGQVFSVNTGPGESSSATMRVPEAFGKLRMWRNTPAATQGLGASLPLAPKTIGFEWDEDFDNGFRPAGLIRLSSTTVNAEIFTDYGNPSSLVQNQPATHTPTLYRAPSGARVFGAGTTQWSWGLDDDQPQGNAPNPTMQQATINLLADLDAQATTPQAGLVAAAKTTDTTKPTSTLTNPPASVSDGAQVTLNGTASDGGGGRVAGVEVSTNGGTTWHPATGPPGVGTVNWSYSWTVHGHPGVIRTRAIDDSGNIETASPGTLVNVGCPCSVWGPNVAPAVADFGDGSNVELGMRFRSDVAGSITGVRFYKSTANTGIHVGKLYTAGGLLLTSKQFSGESASGWQTVTFDSPVQILANTPYVVSYAAPNGHYAATLDYFYPPPAPGPRGTGTVDSPPLHALRTNGTGAIPTDDVPTTNGLFASPSGNFPSQSFNATNYWVDPVFNTTAPGTVTGVSASATGATSAAASWTAPASGGAPTAYEVTPFIGASAQTPKVVTGVPLPTSTTVSGLTTGATYTFKVRASNGGGTGGLSAASNAVTPTAPIPPPVPPPAPPPPPAGPPPPLVMPNAVLATLKSATVKRTKSGRRVLRIVAKLDETVSIAIRLTRGSKTLAKRTRSKVFKGTRTIQINLPSKAPAGNARLRLIFTDSAGKKKTITRTRKVPARRKAAA